MIHERMQKEMHRIEKEIRILEAEMQQFPPGKLICTRSGKYFKWYQSDGKKVQYIPKANRVLAEQLAAKKYISYLLEDLRNEKNAIDYYLRHHFSEKAEQMLTIMPEYQNLISSIFTPLSKELSDWMNFPYEKNLNYPENLVHRTMAGNFVRSKSEAIIDMFLTKNQIPFRYECALYFGETVIYPDFTIRHPHTGETYYWEHFGMMDNQAYCKSTISKLQLYISNGIIPSVNLITTYETKDNPLSTEAVEKIIEYYFL